MQDLFDKATGYMVYLISITGMALGKFSLEQWYFISSILVGLLMLGLNWWHKRNMQKIAREQGINLNEAD